MKNRSDILDTSLLEKAMSEIQADLKCDSPPEIAVKLIYSDDRKIYRLDVAEQESFYILKIRGKNAVKENDLDIEDLSKEFNLLKEAWDSAQHMDSQYSMSRPIALWVEDSAILLSGCVGSNFNTLFNQSLFKWALNSSALKQGIMHCGVWLGNFHQHSCNMESLQPSFNNRVQHLNRMLKVLEENPDSPIKSAKLDSIRIHFEKLFLKHSQGSVGLVHGNFAYRNILYSNNVKGVSRVELVDFEDARIEHAGYDIGQFIAEILFKSQFPWLRHQTDKLLGAFKHGYLQKNAMQDSVVNAYIGYHLVVHLYEHCGRKRRSGLKQRLIDFRINYLAKLIKKWLLTN